MGSCLGLSDARWLEVPSFERGFVLLQEYDSQRVMYDLKGEL